MNWLNAYVSPRQGVRVFARIKFYFFFFVYCFIWFDTVVIKVRNIALFVHGVQLIPFGLEKIDLYRCNLTI